MESKLKEESFSNIGGINRKVSPYKNDANECLDLQNVDFSRPGSLTSRPGTTLYGTTLPGSVTGIYEFNRLNGFSQLIVTSDGMHKYATGTSYTPWGNSFTTGILPDYVTFVDRMFVFNGFGGYRWDGATTSLFSLPAPVGFTATGSSHALGTLSGTYAIACAYVNDRGYVGAVSRAAIFSGSNRIASFSSATFPQDRGIVGLAVFLSQAGSTQLQQLVGGSFIYPDVDYPKFGFVWPLNSGQLNAAVITPNFAISSTLDMYHKYDGVPQGYLSINGGINLVDGLNVQYTLGTTILGNTISLLGATYNGVLSQGLFTTNDSPIIGFEPRFAEQYQNRVFYAGFSGAASTVWFSDLGEPEGIFPENNFEVRTNDGDQVSGMRAYLNGLIVSKYKSIYVLNGNAPENFDLQEITTEYGNISNRSMVVYNNIFYGLDKKGILKYDGANIEVISTRVEDVFNSMNLAAAKDNASAIHNRFRNEVWFAIPTDSSTLCNTTVVYDYVADAFSVWKGLDISSMAMAQGSLVQPTSFAGGYSGTVRYFGTSFLTDAGVAFTSVIKFPFQAPLGQSTEKQFRRVFMNVDPVTGVTAPVTVNLRANYGSSIQISRTMYQNPFQNRIDFGLPARSMSVEFIHSSVSCGIRLHGYVSESREQRKV